MMAKNAVHCLSDAHTFHMGWVRPTSSVLCPRALFFMEGLSWGKKTLVLLFLGYSLKPRRIQFKEIRQMSSSIGKLQGNL
jgi:hypothetical protein